MSLNQLLERKRRERASRASDAIATRDAIARASTMTELREAVISASALDAYAAAAALERAANARRALVDAVGEECVGGVVDALTRDASSLSVRALGGVFHAADVAKFDGLPSGPLLRAAAARLEGERGVKAVDATRVIWGVANYFKRRSAERTEAMESLRAFARTAATTMPKLFAEWDAASNPYGAATLCRALKHMIELHKAIGETVPSATIETLARVGARNAESCSLAQVSFILHDVVSSGTMHVLHEPGILASFVNAVDMDSDVSLEFSSVSALLWSYAKLDALKCDLVSTTHLQDLHDITREELEGDKRLSGRDVAINVYAVARLGERHPGFTDGDYHHAVCKRLYGELDGCSERALCMIAWSLNVVRPSDENFFIRSTFLDALGNAVRRSIQGFAPHELAPTLHALTSLRAAHAKLLELARDKFAHDLDAYAARPQNLTLMLWSFAASEYDVGEHVLKDAAKAFIDVTIRRASAMELKTILQSFARLHFVFDDAALERASGAIESAIDSRVKEYSQSDCEVLAWSLLCLGVPAGERLLERVGVEPVANDAGDVEYVVHEPIDV